MNLDFDKIQTKILDHFADKKQSAYFLDDKHHKLPLSDSFFCAEDSIRNRKFFEWINAGLENIWNKKSESTQNNVDNKNEIVVVDAWSGTWILWIYALLLWADKCYFLEENPFALAYSKELIHHFWLDDKAIFVECDATTHNMPEPFDIIVSETLSSGFVEEDFVPIINNLKRFLNPNWIIIPTWFNIKIEELDTNNKKLDEHNIEVLSHNLWQKTRPKITLQWKDTNKLKFFMDANIFWDIMTRSWDCMSFLNERERDPKDKHPVIDIYLKD